MILTDLLPTIAIGVSVFLATNFDDLLLLAAFFANRRLRRRNIVAGQFLGIGALVLVSAGAAALSLVVPAGWIALLGLAPLWLGIGRLLHWWRGARAVGDEHADSTEQALEARTHSQVLAVAAVTVANGGDNLGVYIPLFANQLPFIALYTGIFALMTALWCALGYALGRAVVGNRWLGGRASRVLEPGLALLLMGLGIYILSGALTLLESFPASPDGQLK